MPYIPSYDFRLFDLPSFSPLQAQEFGASTTFKASDPTSFVDYSLNQLLGLLQPRNTRPFPQTQIPTGEKELFDFLNFFQSPSPQSREQIEADVKAKEEAFKKAKEEYERTNPPPKRGCNLWDILTFNCIPAWMTKSGRAEAGSIGELKSGDSSVGVNAGTFFRNLPQGAGTFLIAIVIIVLLVLFVKK